MTFGSKGTIQLLSGYLNKAPPCPLLKINNAHKTKTGCFSWITHISTANEIETVDTSLNKVEFSTSTHTKYFSCSPDLERCLKTIFNYLMLLQYNLNANNECSLSRSFTGMAIYQASALN